MYLLCQLRVCRLPKGESYCRVRNMNKTDTNSVITNYYQHGPATVKESVTNELLMVCDSMPKNFYPFIHLFIYLFMFRIHVFYIVWREDLC